MMQGAFCLHQVFLGWFLSCAQKGHLKPVCVFLCGIFGLQVACIIMILNRLRVFGLGVAVAQVVVEDHGDVADEKAAFGGNG